MNFDLGYIVVLGAVVIILLIYRQLDKNNRSLEKIRKFAETVRNDLNMFVEERTATIKDFETVLKVHDKTAAEILRRIQAVEDNLLTRTPEIEALQTRLDTYAASLKNLDEMAGRVDTNLTRLKEESEFVDKVGRRIKMAGEQMSGLETAMVQIRQEFIAINQKDLETVRKQALEVFDQETLAYAQRIQEAQNRVESFQKFVAGLEDKKALFLTETQKALADSLKQSLNQAEAEYEQRRNDLEERLDHRKADLEASEESFHQRMEKTAAQAQDLSLEVFQKLDGRIAQLAKETETQLRQEITSLQQASTDMNQTFEAERRRLGDEMTSNQAQLMALTAQLKSDLELKVAQVRQEASTEADGLRDELLKTLDLEKQHAQALLADVKAGMAQAKKDTQEKELKLTLDLEQRLKDYEDSFGYRLQKIEEFGKDIGVLDTNLRQSMERVSQRIQEDFASFDQKMTQRREEEQSHLESRFEGATLAMKALEDELEELKSRAYDNVSEKLQGFEEEFFQDLQKRGAQMQQSFEDWQASLKTQLEDLKTQNEHERAETEAQYNEELRVKVQELQNTALGQFDKLEKQIFDYQDSIQNQVKGYRDSLDETREKVKEELGDLEKALQTRFQQDFNRQELDHKEALVKLERDLESRMKILSDGVDMTKGQINASVDATQSEVGIWQTKLTQKIKELENDLEDQYRDFKQTVNDKIGQLNEEYTSQKEELVLKTSEERQSLKAELANLRTGVNDLTDDLSSKTEAVMEDFRKEYEAFNQEYQKRNRELTTDIDMKLKDYRANIQDIGIKTEALQKKLFGKIEDQANLLNLNLDEIDKKQKSFIAQTKVFERADALRQELQEAIEDLKNDLAKLEVQKKDLFEVEGQITRIKKLGDEASEKLNRFITEKKRIDMLDGDFQKVLAQSQAMELRLEQVSSSTELLQDIQYKIRKLEDYAKDVDSKLERLEKRRDVLESTTDGVDRNFSLLEKMEKSVKGLTSDLNQLPGEMEELRKRMKVLTQGKDEADRAVERLSQMDALLREVEGRISKMEAAKNWISDAESRLQEANKAAEDQVRTLATLTRDTAASNAAKGKSLSSDIRQTVLKLARQGWDKEAIARATKLSMTEVELILEIGTR